jgi:regulator of cell morphogenesis and NO signaling
LIKGYFEKICAVHRVCCNWSCWRSVGDETSGELAVHMKKEELMISPYIRELVNAEKTGQIVSSVVFTSINGPILSMKSDHIEEGQ